MGTEVPRSVGLQGLFLPRGGYAARRTSPKYASFAFIAFARITFFACRVVHASIHCQSILVRPLQEHTQGITDIFQSDFAQSQWASSSMLLVEPPGTAPGSCPTFNLLHTTITNIYLPLGTRPSTPSM